MHTKVGVIVLSHLEENKPYLDLCLRSIAAQTYDNIELHVMKGWERPELSNATKKVNAGIAELSPDVTHICLICDDVVLSRMSIENMVRMMGPNGAVFFPATNQENGIQYTVDDTFRSVSFIPKRGMSIEDVKDKEEALILGPSSMPMPLLVACQWAPALCIFMPLSVWNKVGGYDEALDVRHNDQDFCIRAAQSGFPSSHCFGAYAFHFGGKTLPKTNSQEDLDRATQHFMAKYNLK